MATNNKTAYYFSHDCNARNDEKILMLRAEYGWLGYGLFWALIEMMFENTETSIRHNSVKGIAMGYNIDITVLQSVINTAITEGLFVSDGDTFWSESLRLRKQTLVDSRKKWSEAGKKGMEVRWGKPAKAEPENNNTITPLYQPYNDLITSKVNKVNNNKTDFLKFLEDMKSEYPNLNHDLEYKLFTEYWQKSAKTLKMPKLAWRNWLEKAQQKGGSNATYQRKLGKLPSRTGYTRPENV